MKPCSFDPSSSMISSVLVIALLEPGASKIGPVFFVGGHTVAILTSSAFKRTSLHLFRSLVFSWSLLASLTALIYNSVARIAFFKASPCVEDVSILCSAVYEV